MVSYTADDGDASFLWEQSTKPEERRSESRGEQEEIGRTFSTGSKSQLHKRELRLEENSKMRHAASESG